MDGGGEGVFLENKAGVVGGRALAATERKGLRVKRAKGGRQGISPPSLPPPPPPPLPLSKIEFPRRCQLMDGGASAASARGGRIFGFASVFCGAGKKGREERARRFLVSTGMYARISFLRLSDWFFYAPAAGDRRSIGHGCGGMREEYACLEFFSGKKKGMESAPKAAAARTRTRWRRTCKCAAFHARLWQGSAQLRLLLFYTCRSLLGRLNSSVDIVG